MTNEIVVLTHNDLDATGTILSIMEATPHKLKIFETNYQDIADVTDEVERYINQHNIKTLLVTDVSFSSNKEALLYLSKLTEKFLWIDHHQYPDGFFDDLDFNYIYDKTKSATLLTYEFFKLNADTPRRKRLKYLIDIINAYDIWLVKTEYFLHGFEFNNYSKQYSVEELATILYNNDFMLPKDYQSWTDDHNNKCNAHIDKLKSKNLVYRANNISIVFTDEYINEIVLNEHHHSLVVMIVNSYGLIRFRLNVMMDFPDELKHNIKDRITPVGHLNAFTIKIGNGFDNIMKEIEKYSNIVSEEFEKYKG